MLCKEDSLPLRICLSSHIQCDANVLAGYGVLQCKFTLSYGAVAWVSDMHSIYTLAAKQIPSLEPVKVVISGPSGVGKDAVIKALQASRPDLHFVVTATSRHAPLPQTSMHKSV
jgi:hypothetical protein